MSDDKLYDQISTLHHVLGDDLIKTWDVAIDGGAYEGRWALQMAQRFDRVIAFEPDPVNFPMAEANLKLIANIELRRQAIFSEAAMVEMHPTRSKHSAGHYVLPEEGGTIEAVTIDSLRLPSCGLMKLDLEGAEYDALQGARKTIKRHAPILIVEIKGLEVRYGHDVGTLRALLWRWGYEQVFAARPDFVFSRLNAP